MAAKASPDTAEASLQETLPEDDHERHDKAPITEADQLWNAHQELLAENRALTLQRNKKMAVNMQLLEKIRSLRLTLYKENQDFKQEKRRMTRQIEKLELLTGITKGE